MAFPTTFPGVRPSRRPSVRIPREPAVRPRVQSVDLMRGLVMVVMALDHVRDYFTRSHFDPADLAQTTVPLFLTRWVTHFCAPAFILLAGTSAWMAGRRRTPEALTTLLLTRGLWLIVLEFTVVNFAWYFNLEYEAGFFAQVIWAIGVAMVALSFLVRLPRVVVASIAVALIAGHNLLDGYDAALRIHPLWSILHVRQLIPELHFKSSYPVLPWIGVMAAGYLLGGVLERPRPERDRTLIAMGLGAIASFVVLRTLGIYGDPSPWTPNENPVLTALSFLNTTKYPPSLEYLLMTLGPVLIGLVYLERLQGKAAEWLATFGRAPLFYYVAHLYLIHTLAVLAGVLSGFAPEAMRRFYVNFPAEYGFSLPVVYLVWIGIVVVLYAPTRWFGVLRERGQSKIWAYL